MMSKKDRLLECKYGAFIANICCGHDNKDVSWDDMHSALLRTINTDSTFGEVPRNFKVEELPSSARLSTRDRIAILLKFYETLESFSLLDTTERGRN
jgi:hypothetical protein